MRARLDAVSPLEQKVVRVLESMADDLNKVASHTSNIASQIGANEVEVHEAINLLIRRGILLDPYVDSTGSFVVRLARMPSASENNSSIPVRHAPKPIEPTVAMDAVHEVNRNARTLLNALHSAHLEVKGASFGLSFSEDTQRETGLDFPLYRQAGARLVERGLADWVGLNVLTSTAAGVEAAETPEILDRALPLKKRNETSTAVRSMKSDVAEANKRARRLLAYLQAWSMKGAAFRIGPNAETFKATNLDEAEYKEAAIRLIRKHLAQHHGTGYWITVTDDGVHVAEDDDALDRQLPIGHAEKDKVPPAMSDKKKVFIIHGRNAAARVAVELFLQALKLEPLDFDQLAADMGTEFVGNIVVEGLKRAHGIVTLFSPDEYAALFAAFREAHEVDATRWQSRPNVIFEAGIAFGLARERSILATMGSGVSLFSDVKGIHIVRLDNTEDSRKKFRQKLIGAGCDVDQRADSYTDPARSGDFEAPVAGLVGVSPLDPFRSVP